MPTAHSKLIDILSRRSDLSTFVVHLTRDGDTKTARQNIKSILASKTIEARNPFGCAFKKLNSKEDIRSQNCVSFSEAPLEHIYSLTQRIPKRQFRFSRYGLAFTKMAVRELGVNPVWYVDITPGHDWLMNSINEFVAKEAKRRKRFCETALAGIFPFIEQMGSGPYYRKEFWWEREWRHVGDFKFALSTVALGLAPEKNIQALEDFTEELGHTIRFIDPKWNLERIIAHLCGCKGRLTPFQ